MTPQPKLILSEEEKRSRLWQRLTAHWTAQLELQRTFLEADHGDITTAGVRGRIKEIRANLRLADDPRKTD